MGLCNKSTAEHNRNPNFGFLVQYSFYPVSFPIQCVSTTATKILALVLPCQEKPVQY